MSETAEPQPDRSSPRQVQAQKRTTPDSASSIRTSKTTETFSVPPVEGRTDVGEKASEHVWSTDDAGATTEANEAYWQSQSQDPAEGRNDVATDIEQERKQAYSSGNSGL